MLLSSESPAENPSCGFRVRSSPRPRQPPVRPGAPGPGRGGGPPFRGLLLPLRVIPRPSSSSRGPGGGAGERRAGGSTQAGPGTAAGAAGGGRPGGSPGPPGPGRPRKGPGSLGVSRHARGGQGRGGGARTLELAAEQELGPGDEPGGGRHGPAGSGALRLLPRGPPGGGRRDAATESTPRPCLGFLSRLKLLGVFPAGGQRGRVRRASGEGGRNSRPEFTASGVPQEAFQPGDLAFPQISGPPRAPRPLFSPSGNTPVGTCPRPRHEKGQREEMKWAWWWGPSTQFANSVFLFFCRPGR